jgi:hypothetical protein
MIELMRGLVCLSSRHVNERLNCVLVVLLQLPGSRGVVVEEIVKRLDGAGQSGLPSAQLPLDNGIVDFRGLPVLMVSALDRFGMAAALVEAGADVTFGDFIFALGIDKPVKTLAEFEALAERYLPDACKLPFQFFYPTGKKQERAPEPKFPQYYAQARLIARCRRNAVRAEYQHRTKRNFFNRLNEDGAVLAQLLHDVTVVHNFMMDIDGRPVCLQRQLYDVHRAHNSRAKTTRPDTNQTLVLG